MGDRQNSGLHPLFRTGLVLLVACFATACTEIRQRDPDATAKAVILTGTLAGGFVGLQLATGIVGIMTLAGGSYAGNQAGKAISERIIPEDLKILGAAAIQALESSPAGSSVDWENPTTGLKGLFRPQQAFTTPDGRYCRQFRAVMTADWGFGRGEGVACRNREGAWDVVLRDL